MIDKFLRGVSFAVAILLSGLSLIQIVCLRAEAPLETERTLGLMLLIVTFWLIALGIRFRRPDLQRAITVGFGILAVGLLTAAFIFRSALVFVGLPNFVLGLILMFGLTLNWRRKDGMTEADDFKRKI